MKLNKEKMALVFKIDPNSITSIGDDKENNLCIVFNRKIINSVKSILSEHKIRHILLYRAMSESSIYQSFPCLIIPNAHIAAFEEFIDKEFTAINNGVTRPLFF
jgi:hypothetical protein